MTTNYLTRLVNRAFQRTPVLQRRRPSLFEPPASPARHRIDAWDESGEHDSEPITQTRRSVAEPVAFSVTREPRVVSREDGPRLMPTPREMHDSDRVEPVAPAPVTAEHEEIDPVRHARTVQPRAHPAPHRSIESVIVTREVERPRLVPADAEPAPEPRGREAPSVHVETRVKPETAIPVERERPRAAAIGRLTRSTDDQPGALRSRPSPRPEDRSSSRRAVATSRADRSLRDPAAVPLAAPTVHVTIGRIEVHAARSSEASARASRRSEPTLSLDQYLQSRSGGRT